MATFVILRSVWYPNASDLSNNDLAETSQDSGSLFVGETVDEAMRKAFEAAEREAAEDNDMSGNEGEDAIRLVNENTGNGWASWQYGAEGSDPNSEDAESFVWFFAKVVEAK